jgi:uncharacterized membrane protein YphA (DoxX/SURF4 family)
LPAQLTGTSAATQDAAKLLLRLVLGLLILVHGISKLNGGPGFVLDVVSKAEPSRRIDFALEKSYDNS